VEERIVDLKLKGYCCSQIIMAISLTQMDLENEELIAAMAGLCNGLERGLLCGCLSASACVISLAEPNFREKGMLEELTDWFEDSYGHTQCGDLLEGRLENRVELCPRMVEGTLARLGEMLEW
jgi:hypothetical protein